MLDVTQLTRCYGDYVAVDNVSFTIGRGEIVGLLGHNGAGKTTIMKMVSGYLEPNQGRIVIGELDLATDTKQVQRELGYLPENLPVYPDMVVADYLDFAARLKGLDGQNVRAEIKRVVNATDISAKFLSPISTLSRGFKQRVGVAQAILGSPRLLILDEPTNGLDPTQTEHMRQLIRQLAENATVVLSTHIMQEVDALCDRVLILSGGRLAVDARLEDLRVSNHALLATSLPPLQLQSQLEVLDTVHAVTAATADDPADVHHYRLELASGARHRTACAHIARVVQEAGGDLYALHMEQRDLESLFAEVSRAPLSALGKHQVQQEVASEAA